MVFMVFLALLVLAGRAAWHRYPALARGLVGVAGLLNLAVGCGSMPRSRWLCDSPAAALRRRGLGTLW